MSLSATSAQQTAGKHTAIIASLSMAAAVLLGAFGAHGLKNFASPKALELWQTATLYLLVHGLGLGLVAVFITLGWCNKKPAIALQLGMALFCGSLYAMALGAPRWLGMVTPIGGTAFVIGWGLLAWQLMRKG